MRKMPQPEIGKTAEQGIERQMRRLADERVQPVNQCGLDLRRAVFKIEIQQSCRRMCRFQTDGIGFDRILRGEEKQSEQQCKNLDALGLRKINRTVEHSDSAIILGMIERVKHLVKVEVVEAKKAAKKATKKAEETVSETTNKEE